MKTVICSHGFGVRADARGMFTEIKNTFDDQNFVLFDYNSIDENGNILIPDLQDQVARLQHVIDTNAEGSILLAHSQGSIIAALADLKRVSKVILLAPPVKKSMEMVMHSLQSRVGSEQRSDGSFRLARSDGTATIIPKGYAESLLSLDPLALYAEMAASTPAIIVKTLEDEVVGLTNVEAVSSARIIELPSDHNFTGENRIQLLTVLAAILSE